MKPTNCIFGLAVLIIVPSILVEILLGHKKHYAPQNQPISQG